MNDEGEVLGLHNDFATLEKGNRDGFELHLMNLFHAAYGKDVSPFIHVRFHDASGKNVCQVDVASANRPIFVTDDKNQQQLYIRTNNQTIGLSIEEAWNYCRIRWPN